MARLSVTILTYNEASSIVGCLESLRGVADEIIVVDSFSTDSTVEICRRYGCRVTQRPMAGFGAQRQYATSLTSHSHVLAIDADEALSPALRQSLIALKRDGFAHRGYKMARLNFFCGYAVKHCGWYPDFQVRLFDKRFASWSLNDVEERVILNGNVKPRLIEGDLLHYRCSSSAEFLARCMTQAEIRAVSIAASPKPISSWLPALMGVRRFLGEYIYRGGILDGAVGFAISRRQSMATAHAYRTARNLRRRTKA